MIFEEVERFGPITNDLFVVAKFTFQVLDSVTLKYANNQLEKKFEKSRLSKDPVIHL